MRGIKKLSSLKSLRKQVVIKVDNADILILLFRYHTWITVAYEPSQSRFGWNARATPI